MKIKDLRVAVAAAAGSAVSTWDLTCLPYVPDDISPPVLFVRPDPVTFDLTMARGTDEVLLSILLLVSRSEDRDSQDFLDSFLDGGGASSVKTAVEAGRHTGTDGMYAGDVCDDLHVKSVEAYQWYVVGGVEYLGARFALRCIGSGGT